MATDPAITADELLQMRLNFILQAKIQRVAYAKTPLNTSLKWSRIKFMESNKSTIPTLRGIYAFVLYFDEPGLPDHGYILYVGITGDNNSRTLKDRYGDYLREMKHAKKRQRIHRMLNKWKDELTFCYAEVSDQTVRLKDIETYLLGTVMPPFNNDDLPAELRKAVNAFPAYS